MNFSIDLYTIAQAQVMVAAIEMIAFIGLATLAGVARRASLIMAAANLIFLVAAALVGMRETAPGWISFQGGGFFSVIGIMLIRAGVLRLVRLPMPWVEFGSLLGVVALLLAVVPADLPNLPKIQFIVSISMVFMLVRLVQDAWPVLRDEFGSRAAALILLPFGSFSVLEATLRAWPLASFMFAGSEAESALGGTAYAFGALIAAFWLNASVIGIGLGRLVRRIRQLSEYDPLTGVMNRRALERKVRSERARLGRTRQGFALVIFDLDHFKQVNDTYGHAVGDAVLRHAANLIGAKLRDQDVLGRYGGEEFVVILPMTTREGARGAAERMRRQFEEAPLDQDGQQIAVTASFGVAVVTDPGETAEDIYRRADEALYRAKANGRNRVEDALAVVTRAPDAVP